MSVVSSRLVARSSARLRLTVIFAVLISAMGSSIVVSIYLAMTFLPDWRINDVSMSETGSPLGEGPSIGSDPLQVETGERGIVVVSSSSDILRLLLTTSLFVFAVVLIAGVAVCWVVAGRVLRPVEQITEAARRASSGQLDHRIGLDGPSDEFRRLAETFDDMLGRLDRSFESQKRFTANASHELRTPLATTQAILDVALLDPDDFDRETLVTKLRQTNTRNIETVEALLALSDAESGRDVTELVELDELAREVVASTRSAAAECEIVIHSTILGGQVKGDPTLVRLLIGNLVSNAVRYNVHGGDVWLTVAGGTVRVENSGKVVSDDDLPRLTEPFFRAAGRVSNSHGLGLALVDAIARGHGATLALEARPGGGLVAVVEFPSVG